MKRENTHRTVPLVLTLGALLILLPALAALGKNPAPGRPPQRDAVLRLDEKVVRVSETAKTVRIDVERSRGKKGTVSVDVETRDGSATDGEDYLGGAATLTWLDGEGGSRSFSFEILDDHIPEGNETVLVELSNPSPGARLHPGHRSAVVRIRDNDADEPPAGDCGECEGQVTELSLRYSGTDDAAVVVRQRIRGGWTVIFDAVVAPGETFELLGTNDRGTLGSSIRIDVDGSQNAVIHTSCSEPIGPGLSEGDFEVVSGRSRKGGPLCPVDEQGRDDGGDDDDDDGGDDDDDDGGDDDDDDGGDDDDDDGGDDDDDDDGDDDDDDDGDGDDDDDGGDDDDDDGGDDDDDSGDDDDDDGGTGDGCSSCEGQVTELTLRYLGDEDAQVVVSQRVRGEQIVIFDELVAPGEPFSFSGVNGKETLGPFVRISADDTSSVNLHTSCSEPIGPGLVVGDFEVVEGFSRNGGRLCSVKEDGGEPSEDGCHECDGQVSELTLRYNGSEEALVLVTQRIRGEHVTVFEEPVAPDQPFTLKGINPRGTLGPFIRIFIDGELDGAIHTSCSESIGPGLEVRDFEVVEGFSRNGGRLCPIGGEDD